jgi:hypothetical protein
MKSPPGADTSCMRMSLRSAIVVLVCTAALVAPASVFAAHSVGTSGQIAWVRRATTNFVTAELNGNGAGVCAILDAPLRATRRHRTCAERWNGKLERLLHEPGGRAHLRSEQRAIPSAAVVIHGNVATIDLPGPLMSRSSRLLWTENCWMVEG